MYYFPFTNVKGHNSGKKYQSIMAFRETQDHIMYNMCAKFHQNPCINLGGVGGTNLCLQTDGWTDRRQDRRTDRQTDWFQYTPPNFVAGGIIITPIRNASSHILLILCESRIGNSCNCINRILHEILIGHAFWKIIE
jgi:hypothetical protein